MKCYIIQLTVGRTDFKAMSWSDIFFSGNQAKKDEIARLSGKLFSLVDNCFLATNKLMDCMHKYLPGRNFDKLESNASKSIRDNCDMIIQRLGEMETYLEGKKKDVEEKMDPELFNILVSTGTSHKEKMKIAKMSSTTIIRIAGSVEGLFLCGAINSGNELANIIRSLSVMKTCVQPTVSSGGYASFWTYLWHLVVSVFTGAAERDQQEDPLNDYRVVVQELQIASDQFFDNISLVKATLELTA